MVVFVISWCNHSKGIHKFTQLKDRPGQVAYAAGNFYIPMYSGAIHRYSSTGILRGNFTVNLTYSFFLFMHLINRASALTAIPNGNLLIGYRYRRAGDFLIDIFNPTDGTSTPFIRNSVMEGIVYLDIFG
jgi:hypothetical protein